MKSVVSVLMAGCIICVANPVSAQGMMYEEIESAYRKQLNTQRMMERYRNSLKKGTVNGVEGDGVDGTGRLTVQLDTGKDKGTADALRKN